MIRISTRIRVVKFLMKRKRCFISELCYLGKKKMQIKYPIVKLIVDDLNRRSIVSVDTIKLGTRKLYLVKILKGGKYG